MQTKVGSVDGTFHRATEMRSVSDGMPGPAVSTQTEEMGLDLHQTPRVKDRDATIRLRARKPPPLNFDDDATPRASMYMPEGKTEAPGVQNVVQSHAHTTVKQNNQAECGPSRPPLPNFLSFVSDASNGGSIVEQAWMMKMASEMARRYEEERAKGSFDPFSPRDVESTPPPAYAQ
jgi:distribution and morphology protein 34